MSLLSPDPSCDPLDPSCDPLIAYDGWKPTVEWDGAGNFRAWNVYGPGADEILFRYDTVAGALRYHYDQHGNVRFVLDWNGNRLEKYTYDAFGWPTIVSWTGTAWDEANPRTWSNYGNRFMFQGREFLGEMGIYDYRHRFYHPSLGRFLQSDPMGLQTEGAKLTPEQRALYGSGAPEAFASSEMNLFRYCGDDPMDRSDPLGLTPGDPFDKPQLAAKDAIESINPKSISENFEYAGLVYKLGNSYYASMPYTEKAHDHIHIRSAEKLGLPKNGKVVGDFHTHGHYSMGVFNRNTQQMLALPVATKAQDTYNSDHFSGLRKVTGDIPRANRMFSENPDYRTYLGTPSHQVLMWDPVMQRELAIGEPSGKY